ncbi:MAG: hypothetical protein JOZ57_11890, partial [Abitibacteriaceae bacterium]|nr:hypothetical protein [Abditibacteriaceae bacterium]
VVQGLITLLDEPEFSDIQQARAAMRLFEDGPAMSDLLRSSLERAAIVPESASRADRYVSPHTIIIGSEHPKVDNPTVERFSFVGIAYGAGGEVLGTVGIMGPTRMKYADAIALVPALAARLQVSLETL